MVRDVEIPILGLVENMSYFVCPETGAHHEIFGKGKIECFPGDLLGPIAQKIIDLAPVASAPKLQKQTS
jgi:Mrp family chromosome partitioning ATPase